MEDMTPTLLDHANMTLVLNNLKLGILAHTPDRVITLFNKEAERITGYSKEEVLGKDCHEVFTAPFCAGKCSFCDSLPLPPLNPSDVFEYPTNMVTKDGSTRHLEMSVTGIISHDNEFKGVLASFRDMTETFNLSLKAENLTNFAGIISKDKAMQRIFSLIKDVALYNYPVQLSGDTGTGKERVAYAIHDISSYGNGPFVPINCGAIPEGIVESELFGHVKGAFSGAIKERKGRFELAHKGTLFLDEVAELPLKTQVKLLRFLQEGTFEKVGGEKKTKVDVRIISATNRNLKEAVKTGMFREDLYYRLNVIPIHLPPLRERKNDIPLLAAHFLKEAEQESKNIVPQLSIEALNIMMDYHWPGNVRELKNAIQFSVVRSRGGKILPAALPMEITYGRDITYRGSKKYNSQPIVSAKRILDVESVREAFKKTGGNKSKAARVLGVGRATLYRFIAQSEELGSFTDQF